MKLHTPYKHLVPPLSKIEKEALRADIRKRGILIPIIIDEDKAILDGHHRYQLRTRGQRVPTKVMRGLTPEQKEAFVFRSANVRRNLSLEQRAKLNADMREKACAWRSQDPKFWTQKKLASELGVAQSTISRWFQDISVIRADNAYEGGVNQTVATERPYFALDARRKLSAEQTAEIADRVEVGDLQDQVAADFGITQPRVSQIVRREHQRREQADQRRLAMRKVARKSKGDQGVKVGDWRKLIKNVPDDSVELIFTDPPYHKEALPHYEALAAAATRVLVPGGSLITYCGNGTLPRVLDALRTADGLRYYWVCASVCTEGIKAFMNRSGIRNRFAPMAWFIKGSERFDHLSVAEDCVFSEPQRSDHKWQQSEADCESFIHSLTAKKGLVLDPFCGSGTTAAVAKRLRRRWLTFEIDKSVALAARNRIAHTVAE